MRSSRYHDHLVVWFIIAFILLAALGVFLFYNFMAPMPEHEHTPLAPVMENEVPSTCTVGGSADMVTYCETCSEEVSRETVKLDLDPDVHAPNDAISENVVNPTHMNDGNYDSVVYCKDCDTELSRNNIVTDATGHEYSWELLYIDGKFAMIGTCACDEKERVYTIYDNPESDRDDLIVERDYSAACLCEAEVYVATLTFNGEEIVAQTSLPPEHGHVLRIVRDEWYNEEIIEIVYLEDIPVQTDPLGKQYYLYDDIGEYVGLMSDTEGFYWHETGFCLANFRCRHCLENECQVCAEAPWIIICVYSEEFAKDPVDDPHVPFTPKNK